jgi:aldehyde dehydrogenase
LKWDGYIRAQESAEFGLGSGLWARDMNRAYRMGRGIQAGRI